MEPVRRRPFIVLISLSAVCLLAGCDKGLAPDTVKPILYGFSGTIYFKHWPPRDSVIDLRLGALSTYPVQSIVDEVTKGRASITPTLQPYGADSISYTLYLTPLLPGTVPFIGVAQQFGSNLYTDWRIVGIYHAGGDTTQPGSVLVPSDSIVAGINVYVDFATPPAGDSP